MSDRKIAVATDFSRYPGGRYREDGDNSGQAFRDDVLVPALKDAIKSESRLVVVLDGVASYPVSFLEEAFGGLIRVHKFDADTLEKILRIEANDPVYHLFAGLSRRYIKDAQASLADH